MAPKYLGVCYAAVKSWCFVQEMIKTRKAFKEIVFDQDSRKIDAINEIPLETEQVKRLFDIADADGKILLWFYGIRGFRPAILPQLKVSDIDVRDYRIENGKLRFTTIHPYINVQKHYEGNKAEIPTLIHENQLSRILDHAYA